MSTGNLFFTGVVCISFRIFFALFSASPPRARTPDDPEQTPCRRRRRRRRVLPAARKPRGVTGIVVTCAPPYPVSALRPTRIGLAVRGSSIPGIAPATDGPNPGRDGTFSRLAGRVDSRPREKRTVRRCRRSAPFGSSSKNIRERLRNGPNGILSIRTNRLRVKISHCRWAHDARTDLRGTDVGRARRFGINSV